MKIERTSVFLVALTVVFSCIMLMEAANADHVVDQDPLKNDNFEDRKNQWDELGNIFNILCCGGFWVAIAILGVFTYRYYSSHNCLYCGQKLTTLNKKLACTKCKKMYKRTFSGNVRDVTPEGHGQTNTGDLQTGGEYRPGDKW